MKIKLKAPGAAVDAPAQSPPNDAPRLPGLKLKLKPSGPSPVDSAESQNGDALKQKRKYIKKPRLDDGGNAPPAAKLGPKKRAREDGEEGDPPAKRKPKPTAKSLAMVDEDEDEDDVVEPKQPAPRLPPVRTQSIKLSIKPKTPQRSGTALLKVKGAGRKPVRPFGVGYDSEAEDAEDDPAIESQFVLRMLPGPDCDVLRKSIEEKTIGKSMTQGGPGVYFRFFDREGRRAMVTIQGRSYAASMVELPSVIESMKSWNKKDWVKTADVCQMLLVLGPVQSEDEAKKYPRPSYVDPDSHRFPHGLTPPMRWARKRRFRPRKSYLDVERAETQMNELLAADENAESSKYDLVDSDHESSEAESSEEDEEDEEMANASQIAQTPVEEVDAVDLEQMFMEDDDMEIQGNPEDLNALFGGSDNNALFGDGGSVTINVGTAATAHDVAMHALSHNSNIVIETDTAASTPAAATSAEDDDDDDDADSEDDEVDEAAAAEEARKEQLRAEIVELDRAIQQSIEARDRQNNHIFKKRMQITIDKQVVDRDIKRKQLGEDPDD
ncbi:hypothetical protein P153DRAFT_363885 [Dothidotthia symphoricarpi CBS 119687]|uniref:TAFII55 protein conserved region domain-containing protein n=1 Tax=Dothidotthia symphoricarpi CBS 119687 TaxID=1392245 RepID=A0A6A6ANR0_9PLEO|nr:uncharacterized protein P153DRAFT_363885 [Dothidotthia symphoricarpi CBS 119687]KAF2132584.1 hypothetical protein P153DRAFT_363885 [Dothidotthia symphoricarpi CBS 119687]